ncbi:MAG TPA: phosphotransferase [Actinomycetales bacterium]|nr:phosphotransferase [Actinomycetales bacterium]
MTTSDEQDLGRGTMTPVARCGEWVLRPAGPHTPFVQDLLAVLAGAGCRWAPRPGGIAPDGRERVSFVEGLADWELVARGGDPYAHRPLLQIMRWVRRMHDLTATPGSGPAAQVTCHGDLGVHNLVYTPDGEASGLIDFDLAHRGSRADDLATALKELARLGEPESVPAQVRTAVRLLGAYGLEAVDLESVLSRRAAAAPALGRARRCPGRRCPETRRLETRRPRTALR